MTILQSENFRIKEGIAMSPRTPFHFFYLSQAPLARGGCYHGHHLIKTLFAWFCMTNDNFLHNFNMHGGAAAEQVNANLKNCVCLLFGVAFQMFEKWFFLKPHCKKDNKKDKKFQIVY